MKNKALLFFAVIAISSCAKFDDMNKNPYSVYNAPAESFVQPILYNTEYTLVKTSRELYSQIVQQTMKVGVENASQMIYNYAIPESYSDDVWIGMYKQLGNVEYMLDAAKKAQQPQMEAVALVLKCLLLSNVTDTYGNVPATEAGQIAVQKTEKFVTKYDDQKDIYRQMFADLERANTLFADAQQRKEADSSYELDFSRTCDYTYSGSIEKWRRFGNSLYLRLLMRASLKVEEEDSGLLFINDEIGSISIKDRIAEIYNGYVNGDDAYPIMRNRQDGCLVPFSKTDAALYTPFYSTTSGNWKGIVSCVTLYRQMIPASEGVDDAGFTYYYRDKNLGWTDDPRYGYYFATNKCAVPTQMPWEDLEKFRSIHSSGWYMTNGGTYDAAGKVKSIQNAEHFAIMNFSENLFIFAEAGVRGYIPASTPEIKRLMLLGVQENILEWADCLTSTSEEVTNFVAHINDITDADNLLEMILTQKWVSTFLVAGESWFDYRRTGYPRLKINAAIAENNAILPTRLRYPADEEYRNVEYFREAVDGWLGGTNNMTTDTWWASTVESKTRRGL